MCEINPANKLIFRLEVFSSDTRQTKEQFDSEVYEIVLKMEQELNKEGKYRFHIHDIGD